MARALLVILALLTACAPAPEPARPAFWSVEGPGGTRGWLLGTIHALPRRAAWRSPAIDRALGEADVLAVEIADLDDSAGMAKTFAALGQSPGLPALSQRIDPALREALAQRLETAGMDEADFAGIETWSAALTLARAGQDAGASAHGIDRAVLALKGTRRVIELEGTKAQLGLFDALPETEQRDLLNAVLREHDGRSQEEAGLAKAWRDGDFAVIEAASRRGMLADPELRAALFTGRNRAWAARIDTELRAGRRLFVAVGAAHMAGDDGLVALLEAQGFKVERVQ